MGKWNLYYTKWFELFSNKKIIKEINLIIKNIGDDSASKLYKSIIKKFLQMFYLKMEKTY